MADLNEQLQGLQNHLNSHFQDRQSVTSTDTHNRREPGEQAPSSLREMREISSSDDTSSCSDDTSGIYYSGSEVEGEREEEGEEEEEGEGEKVVISLATAV